MDHNGTNGSIGLLIAYGSKMAISINTNPITSPQTHLLNWLIAILCVVATIGIAVGIFSFGRDQYNDQMKIRRKGRERTLKAMQDVADIEKKVNQESNTN